MANRLRQATNEYAPPPPPPSPYLISGLGRHEEGVHSVVVGELMGAHRSHGSQMAQVAWTGPRSQLIEMSEELSTGLGN